MKRSMFALLLSLLIAVPAFAAHTARPPLAKSKTEPSTVKQAAHKHAKLALHTKSNKKTAKKKKAVGTAKKTAKKKGAGVAPTK